MNELEYSEFVAGRYKLFCELFNMKEQDNCLTCNHPVGVHYKGDVRSFLCSWTDRPTGTPPKCPCNGYNSRQIYLFL